MLFPSQIGAFGSYTQLKSSGDPKAPGNAITCILRIDQIDDSTSTITAIPSGSWNLDWRMTSNSSTYDAYWGGVAFGMTRDVTTETTGDDGTTTTTTTTETQMWSFGGKRNSSDDKSKVTNAFLNGTSKSVTNNLKLSQLTWNWTGDDIPGTPNTNWLFPEGPTYTEVVVSSNKYLTGLTTGGFREL